MFSSALKGKPMQGEKRMLKEDKYRLIKALYYMFHIYFLFVIIEQKNFFWDSIFLPLLYSVIISILTYITYTQNRKKSSNYLIYFLLTGSLAYFAAFAQTIGIYMAIVIFIISFQLSGWYFNKFITEMLFNKRLIRRKQAKVEPLNYLLMFAVISFGIFAYFTGDMQSSAKVIYIVYFFINIVMPLVQITQLLVKKHKSHQSFLIWMLLIPMAAFGPFIFLHAIPLLFGKMWLDAYTAGLSIILLPIGYTYLILSRKILDLTFIFNRTIYYGSLAFFPALFITLIVTWFNPVWNIIHLIQVFVITFLVFTGFLFIKEEVDYYFRNFLFQDKNNSIQLIEQLIKDLANIMTSKDLETFVAQKINTQFKMVDVTIIKYNIKTKQTNRSYLLGSSDFNDIPLQLLAKRTIHTLIEHQNYLGLFLLKQSDIVHYLWIKKQTDYKTGFNISDKSWLITFISYVRLTLENIMMNEKYVEQIYEGKEQTSSSLSRFLFHFAETERRRLAGDIHDTILQDQIFVYQKLARYESENYPEISDIRHTLKHIIDKTRHTCIELLPNTLTSNGLPFSLNELFNQLQQRAPFDLDFEIELVTIKLDSYKKSITIYRVIEELINNAIKHSSAERVSLFIWEADKHIYIDYIDDGKGFNIEEVIQNEQVGLRNIIERIKSVNGNIEFATTTPKNVQIYITIPR